MNLDFEIRQLLRANRGGFISQAAFEEVAELGRAREMVSELHSTTTERGRKLVEFANREI